MGVLNKSSLGHIDLCSWKELLRTLHSASDYNLSQKAIAQRNLIGKYVFLRC